MPCRNDARLATACIRNKTFQETSRQYGVVVGLEKVVYADLTGEKSNQAIVEITCTYGNHSDTVVFIYALRNGEPVLIGSFGNGKTERDYRKYYPDGFIFPEGGARVEKGKLVFSRSADGSHACPKNRVSLVYTWNGKDFVLSGKPMKRPLNKNC